MAGKRILIVDDAITVRQLVKIALNKYGFDVYEGADGIEGLKRCEETQIDLVITDLKMPNKNGLEFVRELRAMEGYAETPIFMLTVESSQEIALEGKNIGVTAWIVKPFKPDQLLSAINKVLNLESANK